MKSKNNSKRREVVVAPVEQFNAPEIVDIDVLGEMLDEDLSARLRELDIERDRVVGAKVDPYYWEVESAYVKRELQIRKIRRERHDVYLEELRQDEMRANALDASLPYADLDNSAFTRLP